MVVEIGDDRGPESPENVHNGLLTYKRRTPICGPKRGKEMKWERVNVKTRAIETPEKIPEQTPGGVRSRRRAPGPGRKWGHTCNAVMKRGRLLYYVFGGFGPNDCQTSDVQVFDKAKKVWNKPKVKGTPPSPRDSHTCTTVGFKLFVFGGTDGSSPLKDLHILDTETNRWVSPVTTGEGPSAREGHSAALIGNGLFVFGGCGRTKDGMETIFNDLYILDTEILEWTELATFGAPPGPRDGHTCSSYMNSFIVVSGQDISNSTLPDVYILDAYTRVWKELKTTGEKFTPRSGHTTVALAKYLLVFGGYNDDWKLYDDVHVLNVESGVWTKETTVGEAPSARFSCAADRSDTEEEILFVGGCNENLDAIDDIFYLNTERLLSD